MAELGDPLISYFKRFLHSLRSVEMTVCFGCVYSLASKMPFLLASVKITLFELASKEMLLIE